MEEESNLWRGRRRSSLCGFQCNGCGMRDMALVGLVQLCITVCVLILVFREQHGPVIGDIP